MSDRVKCFWCEPATVAQDALRRYQPSPAGGCPKGYGYHDAEVVIGELPFNEPESNGHGYDDFAHDDPRWPQTCVCGYAFKTEDFWQHNVTRKFRRTDTGELFVLHDAPVGAMWDAATWIPSRAADGRCLVVKLPDGNEWVIDYPGKPWSRTGEPPVITASPSILTDHYHGHLIDGYLVRC